MSLEIQIIEGIKETTEPIVKLTKSKNGKTGTATFLFLNPKSLQFLLGENSLLQKISLISEKKIQTEDISIVFKEGKPFLIKSIFLFKNSQEWFDFLTFMAKYSQEKGLFFKSETLF